MTKDTGIYGAGAGMIQTGGFGARLFGYAIFYIPVTLMLFFAAMFIEEQHRFAPTGIKFIDITLFLSFIALTPALVLSFWEKSIRKFRRKNGLSVYGNIREELEQMQFNKMYEKEKEMEERARAAYEAKKKIS